MPNSRWSPALQQQLVDRLTEKRAVKPCPRCDGRDFTILEGFGSFTLEQYLGAAGALGGSSVPLIILVCTGCGFVSPHAAGIVMPSDEDDSK